MESSVISVLRKLQTIITIITIIAIIIGIIFSMRYKNGTIGKSDAMFWTCVIIFVPSFIEFMMSILTKESIAKGIFISNENSPLNYLISVVSTLLLCALALFGIFYYGLNL